MFAITTPPAVHAPAAHCVPALETGINVVVSAVRFSPDCRTAMVFRGNSGAPPAYPLKTPLKMETAAVVDIATGTELARFEMVRDAYPHWLTDKRHLIVNYYDGSGSSIPLVINLTRHSPTPVNLADLVLRPTLLRARIPDLRPFAVNSWLYHYYVAYLDDGPSHVTVSAQIWYTPYGRNGEGIVKCYVYSIDKATFRHYRFVREVKNNCPGNENETW